MKVHHMQNLENYCAGYYYDSYKVSSKNSRLITYDSTILAASTAWGEGGREFHAALHLTLKNRLFSNILCAVKILKQ